MTTKNENVAQFAATVRSIYGVANAVLLPAGEGLPEGDMVSIGGSACYMHALVLPALEGDHVRQKLAYIAANFAGWQAVMLQIAPRALVDSLITKSKVAISDTGVDIAMARRIVADAFAIRIGMELYAYPRNGQSYFSVPEHRKIVMLQGMVAVATLLEECRESPAFDQMRAQIVALLLEWRRSIVGSDGKDLERYLADGLQPIYLKEAHRLAHYVRESPDVDLANMRFTMDTVAAARSELRLVQPEPDARRDRRRRPSVH